MRAFKLGHLPFAVAALCAAMSPPLRAQVQPGALPTGWNVIGGSASISRNGNTLNILQTTPQALVNFQTFDVGSGAVVDIRQPGAQSALLARTLGGDPSQIYGQVKANGSLWLINPAGILVGAGARIDVGSFVASTLNVSDGDFLAGRLTFQGGATAGAVRNAGSITAASGGSIYLVAPSVTNTGTLHAPNGEVLLAAGQNVQLMDTGTPGVSVEISGAPGTATNLGRIVAQAGRIGLAAGLVSNSGEIHADSVVSEGGRVFLRASADLKTSATSDISASGTTGGRVELIADGAAAIDGRVAATGSAGKGGYVDTSGHGALDVVNVPLVGRGGEWHIDPYDIEIVASPTGSATTGTNAIVSTDTGAQVGAGTITAQLDAGVDVSITTGTGNPALDPWHGDITVSAPIAKTGNLDSALTLNASNNIVINAPITSANSALALNLNSNRQNDYPGVDHAAHLNANLDLHGGVLTVSEGSAGPGGGALTIGAGTTSLNLATSAIAAATVNVLPGATLAMNRAGSALSGALNNDGLVAIGGGIGAVLLDHGGAHGGVFDVPAGATLAMSGGQTFAGGAAFTGSGTVEWSGDINLAVPVLFGAGGNALVMHDTNLANIDGGLLSTQGAGVLVDGQVALRSGGAWTNGTSVAVVGNGAISAADESTRFQNDGIITTSGTQTAVLRGDGAALANFVNNGSLVKAAAADQEYTGFASTAGSVVRSEAGSLKLSGAQLDGQVQVASGAGITLDSVALNSHVSFAGAGSMAWQNYITLVGSVDVGAGAPVLSLGASTAINGQGNVLTTRNRVVADGAQVSLLDQTVWNNYGTVSVGPGSTAALLLQGSGSFNNQPGGTVQINQGLLEANFDAAHANNGAVVLQGGGTLRTTGADLYNNGSISGTGTLALGGATSGTLLSSGTLFNNGTVAPGTSAAAGTLSVQGNYTQGSTGVLALKLSGLGVGEFDLLDVGGSAGLAGTLRLQPLAGFAPGDAAFADVVVARGGSNSGAFSQVLATPTTSASGVTTLSVGYPLSGTAAARVTAAVVPAPAPTPAPTQSPAPAPAPTVDICTIAPNSALCQVLAPPTVSPPVKPVQQATNEIIKTVTATAPRTDFEQVTFLDTKKTTSTTGSGATQPADTSADGKTGDKATDKSDVTASNDKSGTKNEPTKKMYCN